MIRTVFAWIGNRWVIAIFGLTLVSILIWFVGPLIAISGWEPLASEQARLIAILVVFVIWAAKTILAILRNQRTNDQVVNSLATIEDDGDFPERARSAAIQASEEEIAVLRDRFREALEILKKARLGGRRGRRYLYQLPWYLIIGPPGAGKTTALKNSGLNFPLSDRFGQDAIRGVGGTRNCDWWFTDEAILLDTAGRYTTQDSNETADSAAWAGFLQLLRRHRRRRPIDGVIVAISLSDIANAKPEERRQHASAIRNRIQEIQNQLRVQVPIYVTFTKCDLISGFVEFFDDLGRDDRGQVWGFTFPLAQAETQSVLMEAFGGEFDVLIKRLDAQLLAHLNRERDRRRRGAIQGFIQQMASLKAPLQSFISDAFNPSRFEEPVLVRGVYFTSGTQEGTPIDRILGSISATFGLDRQSMPPFSGPGRSYFLTRLLRDVVFQEANLVGETSFWARYRSWIDRGAYAGVALILILLTVAWFISYTRNESYIAEMSRKIEQYEQLSKTASVAPGGLLDVLPPLNALRDLPTGYAYRDKSMPLSMGFGLYQGSKIGEAARAAYRRALNNSFLPRLLERLEIQISRNASRTDIMYEGLKTYLMLGNTKHLNRQFVEAWVTLDWEIRLPGPNNATTRNQLRGHLVALLEGNLRAIPLDGTLVRNARQILARRPLAERVYAQVKREASIKGLSEWRVTDHVPNADRFFTRRSGAAITKGISGLFTYDGYRTQFLAKLPGLAKEAAKDSWVMGPNYQGLSKLSDTHVLTNTVMGLYFDEYIRRWRAYLNDIDIIAPRDFREAAEVTKAFSSPDSPIKHLVVAVTKETTLAKSPTNIDLAKKNIGALTNVKDKLAALLNTAREKGPTPIAEDPAIAVNRQFRRLHQLVINTGGPPPIEQVLTLIASLNSYVVTMQYAGPSRRATASADPVRQVEVEAGRLPNPVSRWLRGMSRQISLVMIGSARARLNEKWAGDIAPYCRRAISSRYPMARNSREDANLADFAHFFGPQGLVDTFINSDLKPYVDTSVRPWRPLRNEGVELNISQSSLAQLEAAARIRTAFFSGGGAQPLVRFALRPIRLDKDAGQVLLEVGEQRLIYRHGPQRQFRMQWPPPGGLTAARIVFTRLGGGHSRSLGTDGPWALFRLFDKGRIKAIAADRFLITFSVDGLSAEFELKAASVINPFRLRVVEGFRCLGSL